MEDLDEETLLYRYQSDFDLLIITQTQGYAQKIEKDLQLSHRLNKHFQRKRSMKWRSYAVIGFSLIFQGRRFSSFSTVSA